MFTTISAMKVRNDRGFTLIELLIVVAIIAILAAIAIPQFAAYRERGIRASMVADSKNTATNLEAFFSDCQTYPAVAVAAGSSQTINLAGIGACPTGIAGSVNFTSSKGNIIASAASPTNFSITVTNPAAGTGYSPLTLTGGAGEPNPTCSFANNNPC